MDDQDDPLARFAAKLKQRDAERLTAWRALPAANAAAAAEANRLARSTGLPGDTVERNLPRVREQVEKDRTARVIESQPGMVSWFGEPRRAAAAADDVDKLSAVSSLFAPVANAEPSFVAPSSSLITTADPVGRTRDRVRGTEAAVQAARPGSTPGSWWVGASVGAVEGFRQQYLGAKAFIADAIGADLITPQIGSAIEASQQRAESVRPRAGYWGDKVFGGVVSTLNAAPALAATIASGGAAGLGIIGSQAGFGSYGKFRARGATANEALAGGAFDAVVETGTEALPMGFLASQFGKRGLGAFIGGYLGRELPTELLATTLQEASDTAIANPNKTWADYFAQLPEAWLDTAVAVAVQSTAIGGTSGLMRAADRASGDLEQAAVARAGADFLARTFDAAGSAALRERDPEAFAAFVDMQVEQTGGVLDNVYVSADAVRSLYQSDWYDPADPEMAWLEDYRTQAEEAAQHQGDVIIPMSVAATRLPGSRAWEALRDETRIAPGGLSMAETRAMQDDYLSLIEARAAEVRAADDAASAAVEPERRVFDQIFSQARTAGLPVRAARAYADLYTQRYAARAAALPGRYATAEDAFNEARVTIRADLPATVRRYVKADNVDVLVNAMKRDRARAPERGQSLLEFIAARGGVEDPGGDFASMGLGAWHKGKKFRRKALRETNARQATMLGTGGATANSPDSVFAAAIEAGYFPEFNFTRTGDFDALAAPDINAFRAAVEAELSGSPVYAEEVTNQTDLDVGEAADELRALLEDRGIDPDAASPAEIKAALEAPAATPDARSLAAGWQGFALASDLPADLREAVDAYSLNDFLPLNLALRGREEEAQDAAEGVPMSMPHDELVARLDRSMAGSSSTAPITVYRGVPAETIANLQPGETFTDPAYLSTTLNIDETGPFSDDTVIEITVPAGSRGLRVDTGTDGYDQQEVLLARGSTFTVDEIAEEDGVTTVRVTLSAQPAASRSLEQAAYHGTPHAFDRFSLDAIGTGEGAQAFGWGLYFAGKREVAEYYRKALSRKNGPVVRWQGRTTRETQDAFNAQWDETGEPFTEDQWDALEGMGAVEQAGSVEQAIRNMEDRKGFSSIYRIDGALRWLKEHGAEVTVSQPGRLFEVELPEDEDYLLWDRPISEQSPKVQAAVEKLGGLPARFEVVPEGDRFNVRSVLTGKMMLLPGQGYLTADEATEAVAGYERSALRIARGEGQEFYRALSQRMSAPAADESGMAGWTMVQNTVNDRQANDRAASLALRDLGVAGIKYLDGGSRGAQAGSFNFVIFDDSLINVRSYEQGERGQIDIYDNGQPSVIRLFENADLSTLLHESHHLWLEEMARDAVDPAASPQLVADWEQLKSWFAANGQPIGADGVISTEAHEMFARAGERYFMEGKPPSSALQSVFSAFRSWLLRIYQVVSRLNTPLTDEVRDVLGRMIATQDAIDQAIDAAEQRLLPQDALGMTDEEYAAYSGLVGATRSEAFDALLFRTMESVRKARTKEWKTERASVRADVEREIAARPEFVALARLRSKGPDRIRLSRAAIVEELGTDALALLPRGVPPIVVETGGVHPDILAEVSGFQTGREVLMALIGIQQRNSELRAEGKTLTALTEAIETETDARMLERNGDILSDGSIEEEALAAIHSDSRATILASEVRALARNPRRGGDAAPVPTPASQARAWAEQRVREGKVRDHASAAALARHQRNEAKAGRAAERAILDGNLDEAFRQKQAQQIHHALWRATKNAKDEVDKIVRRLDKLARAKTLPSMDQEYLDRIHALLENYDFRQRSAKLLAERASFAQWVKDREDAGEVVYIPPRLLDAGDINFSQMTVEQLTGLDDMVASIAHLGRRKKELLLGREKADFNETVQRFLDVARTVKGKLFTSERNPAVRLGEKFDVMVVKIEELADQLDRDDPNGVMNSLLIRGAVEANNKLQELYERVMFPLADLYNGRSLADQRRLNAMISVPELMTVNPDTREIHPTKMTRMQLLAVALNMGTQSNLDKMIRGENEYLAGFFRGVDTIPPNLRVTETGLMQALTRELNEADWQFVDAVWKQLELLWPDIAATEREMTGVVPERVEPREVVTPFGTLSGGYYPAVYDPRRNLKISDHREAEMADSMFSIHGRNLGTPKGHTVERTAFVAPMLLSVEAVLLRHVRNVSKRIAYGRFVRDSAKFLNDPRVGEMMLRKLGPAYRKQFTVWLKQQVTDGTSGADLALLESLGRAARVNATTVGLGFRVTTMLAQMGGLPLSADAIGWPALAKGMAEVAQNPNGAKAFVFERSPEMSRRRHSLDRDIALAFQRMRETEPKGKVGQALLPVTQPLGRGVDAVRAAAFWGIGWVDMHLIALPTWMGAYRRGIEEGMTEDEAAAYGDKSVRMSQGSGLAKDLSAVQNANEGWRVLTMFYSAFSVQYQRQRKMVRSAREGDYRKASMAFFNIMILAPLLSSLLTGDWPQEDESIGAWALRKVFFGAWAGVPFVRDYASYLDRKVSGQYATPASTPSTRALGALGVAGMDGLNALSQTEAYQELRTVFPDLYEGGEVSDRWLKHAIETPGYFLGLPTGQPSSTIDYLYAVSIDEQQPEDAGDVVKGLLKGRQEAQQ